MATAALFDFDGTLLTGTSGVDLLREFLHCSPISISQKARLAVAAIAYLGGVRNSWSTIDTLACMFRGARESELEAIGQEAYSRCIKPRLKKTVIARFPLHRDQGDVIAVISAGTSYVVTPFAKQFGIDHVICTNLESIDGIVTGRLLNRCWGIEKLKAAQEFATSLGISLEASHFYANSRDDVPLLDYVGHPHPVGTDRHLRRIARARDWEFLAT